jgi:hypothetical protein
LKVLTTATGSSEMSEMSSELLKLKVLTTATGLALMLGQTKDLELVDQSDLATEMMTVVTLMELKMELAMVGRKALRLASRKVPQRSKAPSTASVFLYFS